MQQLYQQEIFRKLIFEEFEKQIIVSFGQKTV